MIETDGFANIYQVMQGVLSSLFAVIALAQFHWSLIVLTLGQSCLLLCCRKSSKKMKQSAVATAQANEAF